MTGPDRDTTGVPRWLKLAAIIVVLLVVLAAGLTVVLGGEHGPSRHAPGEGSGGAGITATDAPADYTPPVGGHG